MMIEIETAQITTAIKGSAPHIKRLSALAIGVLSAVSAAAAGSADPKAIIGNISDKIVETVHAEGVQIYECEPDANSTMTWQFREPLATLLSGSRTVGRHFAGPAWEFVDGSRIEAKVIAQVPGATPSDVPQLLLTVTEHHGDGSLSIVDAVQRVNTRGGLFSGACEKQGALHLEPYGADYVFLRR